MLKSFVIAIASLAVLQLSRSPSHAGSLKNTAVTRSPWDGDWVLSRKRNTKEALEGAAEGYRFQLGPSDRIRWEIPSLHEVVEGRIDGHPMSVNRPGSSGASLSVKQEGPRVLVYQVEHEGRPVGEGRMTLVDRGTAWVDISQPFGRPDQAMAVIYVRSEHLP